jgi:ribonuclease E
MTKRMLIDATHAEETRVVVLDGTRLEDFDVETSTKRQLKGNIYLAKVVRVEPSLQAAFVEYGGNRHGFLAFSEIHPDYYQIPVADRQRLIEMQAEDARREEEEDDLELALSQGSDDSDMAPAAVAATPEPVAEPVADSAESWAFASTPLLIAVEPVAAVQAVDVEPATTEAMAAEAESWARPDMPALIAAPAAQPLAIETQRVIATDTDTDTDDNDSYDPNDDHIETLPPPETIGGGDQETGEDQRERRTPRFMRNYKIQEVIHRRQILLIQVVKEERGTKGAALTTYLSLAGRFGVLMPNSPRGGGISRKITSATDRRRLKEVMTELDIPRGMGMIVRTAGANRPKPEIKRDCEYLLRLWDDIREHTMKSVAPALIYEEASLIKRSIRDVYSRDIDEILVDGEDGWRAAHDFMRMLMPTHAKKVQLWRDGGQPLFARNQVEAQLDSMLQPTVQLRSGGYLVINQTEALVAIDVNSGRSTRERNIEETALRTNLEAADEVARQLRLRDLAGLIVIDFIDMESKRHNAMVERRIKDALKNDRARIQVGHISHFGLLEMSRQRLRPSLAETSFIACPHCSGTGHVRSTENAAIHVLRGIEDEGGKRRSAEIVVYTATPVALYLLNHKRERLQEIEQRYAMKVIIAADDAQIAPQFRIEKVRTRSPDEMPVVVTAERSMLPPQPVYDEDEEEEVEVVAIAADEDEAETGSEEASAEQRAADAAGGDEAERQHKRRRRRRRGGRRDDQPGGLETGSDAEPSEAGETVEAEAAPAVGATEAPEAGIPETGEVAVTAEAAVVPPSEAAEPATDSEDDLRNRRRGRRGGRRRRKDTEGELSPLALPGAEQPELVPIYAGPTPADPFGGRAFDIFDVMDQAERAAEAMPLTPKPAPAPAIVSSAAMELETTAPRPVAQPEAVAPEATVIVEAVPAAQAAAATPEAAFELALEPTQEPAPKPAVVARLEAEIVNTSAPEPTGSSSLGETNVETIEPPRPANDAEAALVTPEPPTSAPVVKPILVGADAEPPAEKKRGWWRR